MTTIEIKISPAFHPTTRKPMAGWSKITGLTNDERDMVLCRATARMTNKDLLIADKDIPAVKARLGI
jgi:hypothetical protein